MGTICFKSLLETKSTPELGLGLNLLITWSIVCSETEENFERESFCLRLVLNDLWGGWVSAASWDPVPEKKSLKPFVISRGLLRISLFSLKIVYKFFLFLFGHQWRHKLELESLYVWYFLNEAQFG